MKKFTIKSGIIAAMLCLFSVSAWAQPNLPADYVEFQPGRESIDTVTVGSRMPYKVDGDPAIQALITAGQLVDSEFKWVFSAAPALTILKLDGTASTPSVIAGHTDYYKEKEISVKMPATAQLLNMTVNEWSMISATVEGCKGTDEDFDIQVVDRPTLQWPAVKETGGCAAVEVTIPLTLTGYGQWEVAYSITYTPLGGGAAGLPVAGTAALGKAGSKAGQYNLVLPATDFPNQGTYTIAITDLNDRISRKSLDVIHAVVGTDIPAANDVYTVKIYPAPATKKLHHVKNVP